jgi:hypothetical protein
MGYTIYRQNPSARAVHNFLDRTIQKNWSEAEAHHHRQGKPVLV